MNIQIATAVVVLLVILAVAFGLVASLRLLWRLGSAVGRLPCEGCPHRVPPRPGPALRP